MVRSYQTAVRTRTCSRLQVAPAESAREQHSGDIGRREAQIYGFDQKGAYGCTLSKKKKRTGEAVLLPPFILIFQLYTLLLEEWENNFCAIVHDVGMRQ
jgi:hypothetical protein